MLYDVRRETTLCSAEMLRVCVYVQVRALCIQTEAQDEKEKTKTCRFLFISSGSFKSWMRGKVCLLGLKQIIYQDSEKAFIFLYFSVCVYLLEKRVD